MRMKFKFLLAMFLLMIAKFSSAQCYLDPIGKNLCDYDQGTSISNTANTITISNPSVLPTFSNPYSVTIKYISPADGFTCVMVICPNSTLSTSGSSITISLAGGCATLPLDFSTSPGIYINMIPASGQSYCFRYTNGSCDLVFPLTLKSFSASQPTATTTLLKWTTSWEQNTSHFDIEV